MTGTPPRHPSLRRGPADLIGGQWIELPPASDAGNIVAHNPARPVEVTWAGAPIPAHVGQAIAAARQALPRWRRLPRDERFDVLRRFQEACKSRSQEIADLICDETGKVMSEARAEAAALSSKVDITLDPAETGGLCRVTDWQTNLGPGRIGSTKFRPHGVMAVLGPFNFPAHLPNGHIVPALAMGNTVVFKPSDKAPGVGQLLGELFTEAIEAEGFGEGGGGVFNVVQGGADIASALVRHDGLDGILFTGSWPVGRRILEANLDRPGRLIALEMGGSNAAVVLGDADLRQAAIEIVRSAFNTAGQRCTCTRRAIIHEAVAPRLIPAICQAASELVVGDPRSTTPASPFMGPLIRDEARRAALDAVQRFARAGGEVLLQGRAIDPPGRGGWYVSPSVVRVDRFTASEDPSEAGRDVEVFGPVLRICTVRDLSEAIEQANASRFGLVASLFHRDPVLAQRFLEEVRAGCINFNTGTAGASSRLPFGGLGLSGNHRPAGSYSLDYCAYPVASMSEHGNLATLGEGMRFDDAWLR